MTENGPLYQLDRRLTLVESYNFSPFIINLVVESMVSEKRCLEKII
jgi:hypothetical protein